MHKSSYISVEVWNSADFRLFRSVVPEYTHHHLASVRTCSQKKNEAYITVPLVTEPRISQSSFLVSRFEKCGDVKGL